MESEKDAKRTMIVEDNNIAMSKDSCIYPRVKKIQQSKKKFICFSIENFIENISLYALNWPKLNFGCYLTFEIIFKALFQWKNK